MEHQVSSRSQQSWDDSDFVETHEEGDDSESDFSEEYGGHQRLDRQTNVVMNSAPEHHSSSGSLSRNTMSSGSNNNSSSSGKRFRRLDLQTMPKPQSHASRWGAAQQVDKEQSKDQSHASRWGSAQQAERNRIQSEDWAQEQRTIEIIEHEKEKQRRLSQMEGFGDVQHNARERRLEEQKKKIEQLEKEQSMRLISQGGGDSPLDLPSKRNANIVSESRWKKGEGKRQNSGKLSVTGLLEDSWANGDDDNTQDEEATHYRGRPINHDLYTHWHQGVMPPYEGHEQMLKEATDQFREVKQERDKWELQQMEKSRANSTSDDETELDPGSTHAPGKMPNFPKPISKGFSRNRSVDSGHIRDLLSKKDSFMSPIDKLSDSNFEDSLISEASAHERQKFSKKFSSRQQSINPPHSPSVSIQSDESWTDPSPQQTLKPTNAAVASFTGKLPTESDRLENDESIHEKSIGYPTSHRSWNQDLSEHLSHNDNATPRTSIVNGYYESWNEKDFEEETSSNLEGISSKQISNKSGTLNNEVGYEVEENKINSNNSVTSKYVMGYEEPGKDGDDYSEEKSWLNDQKSSVPSKYSSSERSWVDRSWVEKKGGAASYCSRGIQSLLQDDESSATNQSWTEPLVRFSEGTEGNRRRSMESARSMNLSHRSWAESFKSWEHDEEEQSSVAWSETSHGISQLDNSVMGSETKYNGNSEAKQNTETASNFHKKNEPENGVYNKAISPEVLVAEVVSAVCEGEQSNLANDGSLHAITNPVTGQKTIEMGADSFTGASFATSATSKRRHQLEGQATAEAEPSERSYVSWRDPGLDASGRSIRNSDAVSARSWNGSNRSWIESQRSWNESNTKNGERDNFFLKASTLKKLEPKHAEEVPDAECASSASDSGEWKSKIDSEILSADQSNPDNPEDCISGEGESKKMLPSKESLEIERVDSRSDVEDAEKCRDNVASTLKQAKVEAPIDPKEAQNVEKEGATPGVRGKAISIPSSNKAEHLFTSREGLATGGVGEVACKNETEKIISGESPNLQDCPSTIEEQIELDCKSRKKMESPKSQDILLHMKNSDSNSPELQNNKSEEIANTYVVERADIQHTKEDERESQNLVTQNAAFATTAVSIANNIAASEDIQPRHEANKNSPLEGEEHGQAAVDEIGRVSQNFTLLLEIQPPIQQATNDSLTNDSLTNLDDYHVDGADVTPAAAASMPFEQRDQGTQKKSRDSLIRSPQICPLDRGKDALNLERNVKPPESLGSTEQNQPVEVVSESGTQQQSSQNSEVVLSVLQSQNASHFVSDVPYAKLEDDYLVGKDKSSRPANTEVVTSEDQINGKMSVSKNCDEGFIMPQDNSDQRYLFSTYTGKIEDKPEISGASKLLGIDRIATVHGTSTNPREFNEKNDSEIDECDRSQSSQVSSPRLQDRDELSKVSSNFVSLELSHPPNDALEVEAYSRSGSEGPHDVHSRGSLSQNDMSDARSVVSQSKQSDSHFMSWGQQSASSCQSDSVERLDRNNVSEALDSGDTTDKDTLNQVHQANSPGRWEDDLISEGTSSAVQSQLSHHFSDIHGDKTHSRSGSEGPHDVHSRGSLSQNDMSDARSVVSQSKQSDSHFMSWGQQSASSCQCDSVERLDRNNVSEAWDSGDTTDKDTLNQVHQANPPGRWEDDLISEGTSSAVQSQLSHHFSDIHGDKTHSRSGSEGPHDVHSRGSLSQNDMSDARSVVSQSKQIDSHFMSWGQQSASSCQSDSVERLDRNNVSEALDSGDTTDKDTLNQVHQANPPGRWEDDLISEGTSSAVQSQLSHHFSDIHGDKTHSRSGSEGPHDVHSRGSLSQNDMSDARSVVSQSKQSDSHFMSWGQQSASSCQSDSVEHLDRNNVSEALDSGDTTDKDILNLVHQANPPGRWEDDLISEGTSSAVPSQLSHHFSDIHGDKTHSRSGSEGPHGVHSRGSLSQKSNIQSAASHSASHHDDNCFKSETEYSNGASDVGSDSRFDGTKAILKGPMADDSGMCQHSCGPSVNSQDDTTLRLESPNTAKASVTGQGHGISEAPPRDNLHESSPSVRDRDSATGDGDSDVNLSSPISSPFKKNADKIISTSDRSENSHSLLSLIDTADANSAESYRHKKTNVPEDQQSYDSETSTHIHSLSEHSQDSTSERLESSNIELVASLGATTSAGNTQGHKDIEALNPFNQDNLNPPPQNAHADETYFLRESNEVAAQSPNENPKALASSTFDQFSDCHDSISEESEHNRAAYFADMDKSASNTYSRYAAKHDAIERDIEDPDSIDELDYKARNMKILPVDTDTSMQDENGFKSSNAEYTHEGSFGASYPNAATMIEEPRMHNDHWQDEDDGLFEDDAFQHVSLVDAKLAQKKRNGLFLGIPKNYWLVGTVVLIVIITVVPALALSGKSPTTTLQPSFEPSSFPSLSPTVDFSKVTWTKVGDSLPGEELRDQAGFSISLSGDGTVLVVGARRDSRGGKNSGAVRLYSLESNQGALFWMLTQDLQGASNGDQFGFSVSLSANGQRLAIGSIGNDDNGNNCGLVQLFENTFGQWVQITIFNGSEEGGIFGTAVALSGRGDVLAVGAPYEASNDLIRSGKAYFYRETEQTGSSTSIWRDMGEPIAGDNVEDWFGWSVSLAEDGMQVLVGAPLEPERATDSGYAGAYIFNEDTDSWDSVGEPIRGIDPRDRFGYSVSLSGDGSRVAVGGYKARKDGTETGKVTVYERNNNSWTILGQSLYGDNDGDHFGYDVSLSWDGNILSVGAPSRGSEGGDGMVRTLKFHDTNETWVQSNDLFGEGNIGFSLCLNSNGEMLATGLPSANEARVYNYN